MKKKLENFWYHYKIQTLLILAFAVILIVCAVQMFNRTEYGVYAMYAGPENINISAIGGKTVYQYLDEAIRQVSGERDLKTSIQCFTYVPSSLASSYVEKDLYYDQYKNENTHNSYATALANGKCTILLLTPELYEEAKAVGALEKMSEVLDSPSAQAFDEYGIVFSETAFANFFTGLNRLPEDTILCFRNQSALSSLVGVNDEKAYQDQKEIFRKIVEFEVK